MEVERTDEVLSGQLDELQTLSKWTLTFAFIATVLAVQGDDPVSVLSLNLDRRSAFFVIAILYIAVCVAACAHTLRIRRTLSEVPAEQLKAAFSTLAAHKWLLNPFVMTGSGYRESTFGSISLSGLVCLFWLCMASLYALVPSEALGGLFGSGYDEGYLSLQTWKQFGLNATFFLPLGVFVLVGEVALHNLVCAFGESADRLEACSDRFGEELRRFQSLMTSAANLGIGLGGSLVAIVIVIGVWS